MPLCYLTLGSDGCPVQHAIWYCYRMLEPILPDHPWLDVVAAYDREAYDREAADWFSQRISSDYQLNLINIQ